MDALNEKIKINKKEYNMTRYKLLRAAMVIGMPQGNCSLEEITNSKLTDGDKTLLINQYNNKNNG